MFVDMFLVFSKWCLYVGALVDIIILFWKLFELVECVDGFYNRTCTGVCGHCVNGEFCNQNNGYCANGCSNHFLYPLCQGNTSFFNFLQPIAYCENVNEYNAFIMGYSVQLVTK